MGRSTTPTYILRIIVESGSYCTPMEWRVSGSRIAGSGYGKPTTANIAKWVAVYEKSLLPGGVNSHIGFDKVLSASITNQKIGEVVAEWKCTPVTA